MRHMFVHFRKTLVTGLVVLVPLVVTIKVLEILFHFTDGLLKGVLTELLDKQVPGLGVLAFLIVIYLAGLLCRTLIGRVFLRWTESVIGMIPLARTIYSGVKHLLGPFGDSEQNSFGKSVMVQYPSPGVYTYGFMVKEHQQDEAGRFMVNVFIASNHLHLGTVIVVDRSTVIELDVTFEEMIKLMASCGAAGPELKRTLPQGGPG